MTGDDTGQRLLNLLQKLLDLPTFELESALTGATTAVAHWLGCDKVDAFLLDSARSSLVALGTSETALGERQKALGLDVLPIANGGRIVGTFVTGQSYLTGRADLDGEELVGIVRDLAARSEVNVALEIAGRRRGVLAVVSQRPDYFNGADVQALELIARWIGVLAQHAEVAEKLRAEESARARRAAAEELVTVLAHDIRNHLNPLAGRLQLLQLRIAQGEGVDSSLLEPALLAVKRLGRMTSSLLDLSRLDQGLFELQLAPLDLCGLTREAAATLATEKVNVQVSGPPELVILGDAERLRQALENVLANGVRHSPPGRPLRVTVEPAPVEGAARIAVTDDGPGIEPELLPHLFERFVSTSRRGGIGLGLYLAERIANAHGGSLRVESKVGVGARFELTLPMEGP